MIDVDQVVVSKMLSRDREKRYFIPILRCVVHRTHLNGSSVAQRTLQIVFCGFALKIGRLLLARQSIF